MNPGHPIESAIAALEAQRAAVGDAAVEAGVAALREKLSTLRADASAGVQHLRQVSVLFMDVVGSTQLAQHLDPEDLHAVLDEAMVAATRIVQAHRGKVLQYAGDGLLAAFGAEHVAEDDAERAVRAGLALLDEGRTRAATVTRTQGLTDFNLRVGVHTGSVLLGGGVDEEGSIRGIAVHVAARMEQTAPPGTLRISQDTYSLVRGRFDVEVQAPLAIKGVAEPVTTYLVRCARPQVFGMLTSGIEGLPTQMVGRAAELRLLQAGFEHARRTRSVQVVSVLGEAGLGKSRLLHEFDHWVAPQVGAGAVLRGRAQPQRQTQACGLLRDVLLARLGIDNAGDDALVRRRFEVEVTAIFDAELGVELAQGHAHVLGHLIGLDFPASPHVAGIADDRAQLRARGFHVATQLLRCAVASGPVVLLLDDLQWADDASLAWLDALLPASVDIDLVVIAAARPALLERHPDWLDGAPSHSRAALQPLDAEGSAELAAALLRRLCDAPPTLRQLLMDGAAGNPFYMEELLEMLIDERAIDTSAEVWSVHPERLQALRIPPTLTGVLQARLDSVGERGKHALQLAALVGPVFWSGALAAIDPKAPEALPALLMRDLVLEQQPSEFEGSIQFAFKHHLLHQVTYDTVLKRTRRDGHARVAVWLAGQGDERAKAHLAAIAEHFEKAGDPANASEFYARAAEFAATRLAHEAVLAAVARALALAGADALCLRWRLHLLREREFDLRGDRDAQADVLVELQGLADAMNDDAGRAEVELLRSTLLFRTGHPAQSAALADAAFERAQGTGAQLLMLRARHMQAIALYSLGDLERARAIARAGVAAARASAARRMEMRFLNALAVIAARATDLVGGYDFDRQALQLCRDIGNAADEAVCLSNLGNTMIGFGDFEQAQSHLDEALRLARAVGVRFAQPHILRHLAVCALQRGDAEQALELANQAHALSIQTKDRESAATNLLCIGQSQQALGHASAAQSAFLQAHALFADLGSPQRLDACAGLARVAIDRGDTAQAAAQVATLLSHFAQHGSFEGAESPQRIHIECVRVLRHCGDPRALAVLEDAHSELQAQAAHISDPRLRHCFLEGIAENREIVQAWLGANEQAH